MVSALLGGGKKDSGAAAAAKAQRERLAKQEADIAAREQKQKDLEDAEQSQLAMGRRGMTALLSGSYKGYKDNSKLGTMTS